MSKKLVHYSLAQLTQFFNFVAASALMCVSYLYTVFVCDRVSSHCLRMLLIILCLVMMVLALSAIFFLFADGDLTLMWVEHFGRKSGECIL